METTTIPVKGMTCMGCVSSVQRVLNAIEGVTKAEVSLQKEQAAVTYDPAKANLQTIKSAIEDAGYDAG